MFEDNDLFIFNDIEFPGNVAPHNILRCLWIGSGKTFQEINKIGSLYREKGIVANHFHPESSPIQTHLNYDIKKGWITCYRKRGM